MAVTNKTDQNLEIFYQQQKPKNILIKTNKNCLLAGVEAQI